MRGSNPQRSKPSRSNNLQARFIMGKDESDHRSDFKRRRTSNCLFQQTTRDALPPEFFIDVNTDFRRAAIRSSAAGIF